MTEKLESSNFRAAVPEGEARPKPGFRVRDELVLPFGIRQTISAARAAEMLKCSADTILRMVKSGQLIGYQLRPVKGSGFRISYDSVLNHMREMCEENGLEPRFKV